MELVKRKKDVWLLGGRIMKEWSVHTDISNHYHLPEEIFFFHFLKKFPSSHLLFITHTHRETNAHTPVPVPVQYLLPISFLLLGTQHPIFILLIELGRVRMSALPMVILRHFKTNQRLCSGYHIPKANQWIWTVVWPLRDRLAEVWG